MPQISRRNGSSCRCSLKQTRQSPDSHNTTRNKTRQHHMMRQTYMYKMEQVLSTAWERMRRHLESSDVTGAKTSKKRRSETQEQQACKLPVILEKFLHEFNWRTQLQERCERCHWLVVIER